MAFREKRRVDGLLKILSFSLGLAFFTETAAAASYVPGHDRYTFTYEMKVPELTPGSSGELWLPLATSDRFQKVTSQIDAAGLKLDEGQDPDFGNRLLHTKLNPADSGKTIRITYDATREEHGSYPPAGERTELFLRSERLVPLSPRFRAMAAQITAGQTSARGKARAIYDYVLRTMTYDKSGTGWGRGDAVYACDAKTGNCTDFHALFIALARSAGIPASFSIGFTIPPKGTAGRVEGYHCWAAFFADGQWVPIDLSEAWKAPAYQDYYFGHHPANRLAVSHGRDLRLEPAAASGTVNFLVYPYLEVNGKPAKDVPVTFLYSRPAEPAQSH